MDDTTPFGTILQGLRIARGLTQEALAEQAGLSRNAIAALERGRRQHPYPHTVQALSLYRKLNDHAGIAQALNGLSKLALDRGELEEASVLLSEAENLARATRNWGGLSQTVGIQALIAIAENDESRAETLLRESVELSGRLHNAWGVVIGTRWLAGAAARRGQLREAARLWGAAEALGEKMGVEVVWADWREPYERDIAWVQAQLDPQTFESNWAAGRALTLDQTVAEVLGLASGAPRRSEPGACSPVSAPTE